MGAFNIFNYPAETTYTKTLSNYLFNLHYEDIPEEVIHRAKQVIIYTIGCSLASTDMELSKAAERIAGRMSGAGQATSWLSGKSMSAAAASFVNGSLSDMLDWEDCAYTGHPSAAIVPAVIALGETVEGDGKKALTSFVGGYELYQRIALAAGFPDKGRKPAYGSGLPNWSVFASSMAAAKYYGLDEEKINQSIGMTVLFHKQMTNLQQGTLSEAYHYESGWCAQCGIQAAQCTKEGFSNLKEALDIPFAFLEHQRKVPQYEWLDLQLGERYFLMELLLKHWPANMWIQTPLEAMLTLKNEKQFKPEEIEEIVVDPPLEFRMHVRPEGYNSLMDAEFSTPFCLATALYHKNPGPEWYDEESLHNPDILALAMKVKPGESKPDNLGTMFNQFVSSNGKAFPPRTVTVKLKDGTVYSYTADKPKGHPANMFTDEELHSSFLHQASYLLTESRAESLFQYLMELEKHQKIQLKEFWTK